MLVKNDENQENDWLFQLNCTGHKSQIRVSGCRCRQSVQHARPPSRAAGPPRAARPLRRQRQAQKMSQGKPPKFWLWCCSEYAVIIFRAIIIILLISLTSTFAFEVLRHCYKHFFTESFLPLVEILKSLVLSKSVYSLIKLLVSKDPCSWQYHYQNLGTLSRALVGWGIGVRWGGGVGLLVLGNPWMMLRRSKWVSLVSS